MRPWRSCVNWNVTQSNEVGMSKSFKVQKDRLYCAENRDVLRAMKDQGVTFDLCYADPIFQEKQPNDLWWIYRLLEVASDTATLYVHTDQRSVVEMRQALLHAGWFLQAWVVWGYDWGGRSRRMWGAKHDDILVATKHPKEWTFNVDAVSIPKVTLINSTKTRKIPTDVWSDIGIVHTMSKEKDAGRHRVWQKPEKLLERIIRASSNPGDLVLDPFLGTGTSVVVAKREGRHYVGCDRDAECVGIAQARLDSLSSR